MTEDLKTTGVERYDRYRAAVRGKVVICDEAGSPEWQRLAERAKGSKVELVRERQKNVEVRNVQLAPGQKLDLKVENRDGGFVLNGLTFGR